ncbi:ribose 5-phosphate isomerase B [Desulfobacca acetoxidans]|uniref:Sugar-phosphate isomerase, RpiB/LacA/LacB family n=1 Tax=Desulfobacca acetoxidans (strain ATCC 700848 / DSM 11109 / ASRB2) TaxID=880072 RepID=F2NG27_DESAR|nr:ribose 5-phosphate isomerase B [Desulfobacca acetoxidans]AEB08440.1 sugar-phosphate isomerase, RpiB/LacA/LacB family [Desulfobacca acetoxidans DSM 11109]
MANIFLGSDHAGFGLKKEIIDLLQNMSLFVLDMGCDSETISVDYPLYARKVVEAVLANPENRGILICGTGLGMSVAANRFPGIRAALCQELYTAKMSRLHNDANILVMGGRIVGSGLGREIVRVWLSTPFEGGRHQERLNIIDSWHPDPKDHL